MSAPSRTGRRRCRGERGMAMVTGLVLLFAFTAGGVIWLSRDVNRVVGNRSTAQSIAFQAARSGAQQVEVGSLRDGVDRDDIAVDRDRAREAATDTGVVLLADYGVEGDVSVSFSAAEPDLVMVAVVIDDPTGQVTGVASARASAGP